MSREDVSKTWLLRNSPSLGTPFQTLQNSARNRHCEGGARNDFGFNVLEHLNEIFEITGTWKEGLVYYKVDICRISRVCTMASFFIYAMGKKVRVVVFQFGGFPFGSEIIRCTSIQAEMYTDLLFYQCLVISLFR